MAARLSAQYRQAVRKLLQQNDTVFQCGNGDIVAIAPIFRGGKYLGELEFCFGHDCLLQVFADGSEESVLVTPKLWRLIEDESAGLSVELLA